MANCPTHHVCLTEAMRKIGDACCLLKQAHDNDSSYKPLLEEARKIYGLLCTRYMNNCKRGNKEGWFK